jgi:ferric-dicitrate binding protein FerR (iron transport regulator)
MPTPDYHSYGSEELLFDEAFRGWVLDPTPEREAHWQHLQAQYPHLTGSIAEARPLVRALRVEPDELGTTSQQRIWQVLESRFDAPTMGTRRWMVPRRAMALAASVAAVLLVVAGWWWFRPAGTAVIRTAYGETRELALPDGSTVLLNGNSTLRYADRWEADTPREVWLEGEAFFRVTKRRHAGERIKFVTHTPNADIRVLGTQFNVDTRRGQTDVTLVEGTIQLSHRAATRTEVLDIRPGQRARVRAGTEPVTVERVNAELHEAWTRNRFVFENTPLRDIAQRLHDVYGLEVTFADDELADKRFTANLSSENLETLLTVIAATYHLDLERSEGRVRFTRQ